MKKYIPFLVLGCMALLPLLGLSDYLMHILILVLMWSVIGMAWNLLGGYCGQVSFGHAAFFGVGAYSAGMLYYHTGIAAWWGMPIAIVAALLVALGIGVISLRLRGPYFVLSTLAIGEIFRIFAENLETYTQGNLGIMIQERTWVEKAPYFYIILGIAALTFAVVKIVVQSKWGYYFVAIREDQYAAESLGINSTLFKTIALSLSGVFTGIAGAFYMNYMGYIDPGIVFALGDISILTVMVVMVGGVATYWGPVVGAVIMVFFSELIRSLPTIGSAHQTLFGILLIVIIIFLPNGIAGDLPKLIRILGIGRKQ
ncbi:MAG TPA: branched-chain amino acid ABC transporter permease [Dissulfurispiraceae bacterium]|nr:branched-chain amino acid ABC transporter permease [Dissulfurispiraceae bacterium]